MENNKLSRREFLKLAGVSLAGLPLVRLDRAFGLGTPEGTPGVDFDSELAPNMALIGFAVDSMLLINNFPLSGRPDFENTITQGLIQKGYESIAKTDTAVRALRLLGKDYQKGEAGGTLGWGTLLSATGGQMYGAPVDQLIDGNALSVAKQLLGQEDGDGMGVDGRVVIFKGGLPDINTLLSGDRLFIKNGFLGFEKGQELIVLARAHMSANGEPVILGSYIDNQTGLKGGISTSWMTQENFNQFAGKGLDNQAVAVRNADMYLLTSENRDRLSQYEALAKEIGRGELNSVRPNDVAEAFAGIVAKADSIHKTEQDKSIWIAERLGLLHFLTDANAKIWVQNRAVYDKQAFGLSRAMLFTDLFPRDAYNDIYTDILHKSIDIFSFVSNLPDGNEVVSFTPNYIDELAVGDSVIVSPRQFLPKPEVGVVTFFERDPDSVFANVIFFDWKGSGLPREISIQNFADLQNVLGGTEVGIKILRSEAINEMKFIESMRNRYILDSADIPDEIKNGVLGMHADYRNIPRFRALQDRLLSARNLKERGEAMMQIAALMGVQTKDGAEKTLSGYQWNVNRPEDMCNLYSTSFVRALGLDKEISHWALDDGTPAFNAGHELSAKGMNEWMVKYGSAYGWFPVTRTTKEERLDLLGKGYVMYGAKLPPSGQVGDTLVVYGVEGENGAVLPVLTKATWNFMSTYPYRKYHFADPMDYFNLHPDVLKDHPDAEILWAHAPPKARSTFSENHGR